MIRLFVKMIAFAIIICDICILFRIRDNQTFNDLSCVVFVFTLLLIVIGLADFMIHYKDSFCEYLRDRDKRNSN